MTNRSSWVGSLGLLGLLMLVSHQNCAPAGMANSASSAVNPATSEGPLPVTIIDNSKSGANLSFQYDQVQVLAKASSVPLVGNCDQSQDGATFGWKLNAINPDGSAGAEIISGSTTCESGSFNVDVPVQGKLACNSSYKVTARLGFGVPGEAVVTPECQ
jgi:hypothetical protein